MYGSPRGNVYQSGSRFTLNGWSPSDWASLFGEVEPGIAQLYGTVTQQPVAPVPVPVQTVATPIGQVPTYVLLGGVILLGAVILKGRH